MDDTKLATWIFLIVVVIAAFTAHASAGHAEAVDTADKINTALNSVGLPYERNLTQSQLNSLGYDKSTMVRTGTYTIRIKSASVDTSKGILTLYINAWNDGQSVQVRNPVHWYIPGTISGSNNNARINTFVVFLIRYLEYCPNGEPLNDDTLVVYVTDNDHGRRASDSTAASWATLRASGGDTIDADDATIGSSVGTISTSTTSDQWDVLSRFITVFNTSALPDTCTIDSAIIAPSIYSEITGFGTYDLGVTGGSVASTAEIVAGDFDTFTDVRYATDQNSGSTRTGYINYTLNAAGLANISKTGFSTFFFRTAWDIDNSPPVWASATNGGPRFNLPYRGGEYYPVLYITYTPGGGSAPVAAFSANTTIGYPPFDLAFTDSSTNTPTAWSWLFGDGETSSTQSPNHTYDSWIGNVITKYHVNLSASNAFGSDWENKSEYITAFPLNASFTINETSGCAPLHVGFTDATDNGTPSAWNWTFGGDGYSSSQSPTHVFNTPGTYWVLLNTSNSYSWDLENKTSLITVNAATVAAFSANVTVGCPPLHVGFTDASGAGITNWTWDFNNDGTPDSYDQNPTAIYGVAGPYTVNLTVTGPCGVDSEIKTDYITVSSGTVAADFSADDTTVVTGQTVTFTDLSTGGPTTWEWEWGDGEANGTTQNPTHTYATPGDFTVILTATNGCGGSDTEGKVNYINVTAAPTPTPTPTGGGNVTEGNITYILAPDQDYVPFPIWLALVIVTIALFGHSLIFLKNSDITAIMAALFALISAGLSNMIGYIDVQVTSYAEEIVISPLIQAVHPPWLVYTMLIFAFVSVLNIFAAIYKVYLKPVPWNEIYDRKLPKWERRK
jgi:PKD repeat protein